LPLKIIQNNKRVAEVQFVCDSCGKLVRTSLITREEAEAQKEIKIICWECKNAKPNNE
jgi:hypothetical protein